MPARPTRYRLVSGSCPSVRGFAPCFLPTLGRPHAVALRFVRCGQLTGGLTPPRSRPCWAHMKTGTARCPSRYLSCGGGRQTADSSDSAPGTAAPFIKAPVGESDSLIRQAAVFPALVTCRPFFSDLRRGISLIRGQQRIMQE